MAGRSWPADSGCGREQRRAAPRFAHSLLISRASQSGHAPYTLCACRRCGARLWGCRRDLALNVHVSPGNGFPALVLNADFRPLSYYPLSLWSWQDTIKAVFLERVNIVEQYDQAVRSPSMEMKLPSVVSLKTYVKPSTNPAFTRFNVFLRDRFVCQYCGSRDDLTFDHLLPRSRGGHTTWMNVVAACSPCNLRKGNMTPAEARMFPSQTPMQPSVQHLHRNGRLFPPNYLHQSWMDYLYWDSELDP
jgi:5-methylcytosine-specific restriction endonuclease McrA